MDYFIEHSTPMRSRSVDQHNRCRPSALLTYLQEAATKASEDLDLSRRTMLARNNVIWMLVRIWFRLERPIGGRETLLIRTWHRGGKGITTYRDFDIYAGDALVGEAVSSWVLADQDTRKLLRMDALPEFENSTGGSLCKTHKLQKMPIPIALEHKESRLLYDSDTDINGHVNNSRYADFACDALSLEHLPPDRFISEMQLGYLAECRPGETLALHTGWQGETCYTRGADQSGQPRFDAKITTAARSG